MGKRDKGVGWEGWENGMREIREWSERIQIGVREWGEVRDKVREWEIGVR